MSENNKKKNETNEISNKNVKELENEINDISNKNVKELENETNEISNKNITDVEPSQQETNEISNVNITPLEEETTNPTYVDDLKTFSKQSVDSFETDLEKYMSQRDSAYEVYPGTERLRYDFAAERCNTNTATNLVDSTAHLIKACLGAGLLSMHVGFMYGGIWTSLAFTLVIGLLLSHSMMILVRSAQRMYVRLRIPKLSYPDLAEVAFATGPLQLGRRSCKAIRYIIETCLFVEMCGACCVYEIMIASTMKKALEQVSPAVESMNINERSYILCVMGPLILICMIRSLKYLAPFSLAADLFIGVCVLTTIYYSLISSGSLLERPGWKSLHGMLRFNGICLFAIDGVAIALPVENNMKKPKYFNMVLQYAMVVVVTSAAAVGFFGFWGWGEKCRSPITIHMPEMTFPLVLQFLMAITLTVTFAVQFWVAFRILWSHIGRRHKINRRRGHWERLYRVIHVVLITCVAVAFPDLIGIIIFLGNSFMALIAFIFPALIECLVCWRDPMVKSKKRWLVIKNGFLLGLGVLVFISAFYSMAIFG